jgi:hypothetical protein
MTGTVDSMVARNRVYDHTGFGIVLAPFPSDPNSARPIRACY